MADPAHAARREALTEGTRLQEHQAPIPKGPHDVLAVTDATVLLTVAPRAR